MSKNANKFLFNFLIVCVLQQNQIKFIWMNEPDDTVT